MKMGIGALDARTSMTTGLTGQGSFYLVRNVVMANTPQLVLSLVYFAYNGIFTTMSLATEWSGFASSRKGLRRSGAGGGAIAGAQRTAYSLQLPYRFAVPLMVTSGSLHWLISQSIFLVYLESYVPVLPQYEATEHNPGASGPSDIITCGWSPPAVLCTLLVTVLMTLVVVGFGFGKLPTAMPSVGSCSAAIAAACHPPTAESGENIWEKEVQWGVTLEPRGEKPGHCSFSSSAVRCPLKYERYL